MAKKNKILVNRFFLQWLFAYSVFTEENLMS